MRPAPRDARPSGAPLPAEEVQAGLRRLESITARSQQDNKGRYEHSTCMACAWRVLNMCMACAWLVHVHGEAAREVERLVLVRTCRYEHPPEHFPGFIDHGFSGFRKWRKTVEPIPTLSPEELEQSYATGSNPGPADSRQQAGSQAGVVLLLTRNTCQSHA